MLKGIIKEQLDLTSNSYYIDYAYGYIPKVIARNKQGRAVKYKPPTDSEARSEYEHLRRKVVQDKPDIIIPTGNLGCKALLGKQGISKLRGVPEKVVLSYTEEQEGNSEEEEAIRKKIETIVSELQAHSAAYPEEMLVNRPYIRKEKENLESILKDLKAKLGEKKEYTHECWVLPTFSMDYLLSSPKVQNLVAADFSTLSKYLKQGDKAFEASPVEYEFVDTMQRVEEIFTKEVRQAPIVSWDLETNTLHPELPGAKPLVITLSWKEGTGCTIPLEHKDFSWGDTNLQKIYSFMEDFLGDEKILKVGQNIQYDIRFLNLTKGFTKFTNHYDTKVMYYLLIDQAVEQTKKLSDLAYELTDMGGYDKPLEDYKTKYIADYLEKEKKRIADMKAQHKKEEKERKERAKREKVKFVAEKKKFPSATKPVNEVDGSDFNYEWFPLKEVLHPYASGDVDACLRIFNRLDEAGSKESNKAIQQAYRHFYPELTQTLAKVEANGLKMNIEYTDELEQAYSEEEERIIEELRKFPEVQQLEEDHYELYTQGLEEMAKPPKERDKDIANLRNKYKKKLKFNPKSTDDKQKVTFLKMGIKLPFNKEFVTDKVLENNIPEEELEWYHYKTDKGVYNYIKDNYKEYAEFAELMLYYSQVTTRKTGYTYKLRNMADPNGFLHGGFNSTGTETGRLSSSNPNMQQIPSKTGDVHRFDYRYPIKRMFVTRFKGGALLQLDYSSLESRVMALAAGDEEMTKAFLDGGDVHTDTAVLVNGLPPEEITGDLRQQAKAVTFGIAYGENPFSFAPKHGMTVQEAEVIFEKYFQNKPKVKTFIDKTHEEVKQTGQVVLLNGLVRNLRDVYSQDKSKVNEALRQSVNTKIQGSGAYLTNMSLIYIQKYIEKNNMRSRLVLTVHDSIVIDSPPEEIAIMEKVAKHIMENLPIPWLFIEWEGKTIRYPIKADSEIGVNYNDMVDYDEEELKTFNSIEGYCKYYNSVKHIKNYKDSKAIDEDKYNELIQVLEANKGAYQVA